MSHINIPADVKRYADILKPDEAIQPILPPAARGVVHQWMTEITAEDELAAVNVAPRRSAILSGPPGCGKTTLAHHLAGRLAVPLVCVNMDQLISKYLGESGRNIAAMFSAIEPIAKDVILFMDEIDAIGAKRSDSSQGADQERNAIVNHLLKRTESYHGTMIAATNRPGVIDPALHRRFGLQLEIPLPGQDERFAIMTHYLIPFTLDEDALGVLTDLTAGAAPSLLRQIMEGVKRDLILAPRLNYNTSSTDTFARIVASTKPHEDYDTPPLWNDGLNELANIAWPPQLDKARAA